MIKDIEIIFEDKDILVCRKPAGVATQTKRLGQQDMESLLKNYRAKKGEPPYIGIVHRLDQPVEGVMVFAKNQKAAANLSKQVQDRVIGKYYYAISSNSPQEPTGILEDYLLSDKKVNVTKVVPKDTMGAKKAKLEYCVIETKEDKTLFQIKLHTGRQHQIRVQMASIGCALVGDNKYGDVADKTLLALCSYKLEFQHPTKKMSMEFEIQPAGKVYKTFFK